jgi:hypothetical protein
MPQDCEISRIAVKCLNVCSNRSATRQWRGQCLDLAAPDRRALRR